MECLKECTQRECELAENSTFDIFRFLVTLAKLVSVRFPHFRMGKLGFGWEDIISVACNNVCPFYLQAAIFEVLRR